MKKYVLRIGEKDYSASVLDINNDLAKISVNGNIYDVNIKEFGLNGHLPVEKVKKGTIGVPRPEKTTGTKSPISGDGIKAPMPGVVLSIKVKEGERIKAGEHVLTIEAMKMENEIKAPYDGIVGKIHVGENDNVSEEDLLVELKRPAMTTL
ncbi:MAG: biotin/lipoyl-containing protein [Acidobacteriota bacterium]